LDKVYRPETVEERLYAEWERAGAFVAGRSPAPSGETPAPGTAAGPAPARPYSIVIPPPNVTGSLHMGHALNNTLQDILVRFQRMRGRDVLWLPGTDHAGIATQMVVERQLKERSRFELGRDEFVARVWRWKEESGGLITRQLRRLGCSCDWSRERFTMDTGLSEAVRRVFVDLYRQGLIYRDKRLVNWDPKLLTALSDLEVEQREVQGFLWYIKYPVLGVENTYITVATTRPETMLGDTAVAVHPDDERYRHLIGRKAELPLVGRHIPVIADLHTDPAKGSGAVKITPAHDFDDFEVARRHGLAAINIFDPSARLNDQAPERYRGLERYRARERIIADLRELGLLQKVEPQRHVVPHGDRSGVPIEPRLMDQWYVDAAKLAAPAIAAVERGEIAFVPRHWENTFFDWMRNIQPWCISRQIWWGHQIPAWYGPDGFIFVATDEADAYAQAKAQYGRDVELSRDEDVLDTWFSSALWPFSTLGWPQPTEDYKRYYPTDVLVTGFDIIFFWVARMIMMGLHFTGEVPFRAVYIHALVRDAEGRKMSKSKGNVIDPLDLIERYGADALRVTLAALAAQGRDIKLSPQMVEGYRNFATKLWNAARFASLNECAMAPGFDPNRCRIKLNRWIIGELVRTDAEVTQAIEGFRFNDAALALYHFVWGTFCDWYLEFIKPALSDKDEEAAFECRHACAFVLEYLVHLLHPFMPFVTEELWRSALAPNQGFLMLRPWPNFAHVVIDHNAREEMEWVIALIGAIRSVRAELNVPPAVKIELILNGADRVNQQRLFAHAEAIGRLARLKSVSLDSPAPADAVSILLGEATAVLPLGEVIDLAKEKARLADELEKKEQEARALADKLANAEFVAKAPEQVIENNRERQEVAEVAAKRLRDALARFG
jgi:valyl-tRNA synthetase